MIYWVFCSKDVFALDSIIRRIGSYLGVRKVDVLIPTHIEYHKEAMIKEIERKLVAKREMSLEVKEIPYAVALEEKPVTLIFLFSIGRHRSCNL